jgi:uncharacterized protein YybS (DUF2232 family)
VSLLGMELLARHACSSLTQATLSLLYGLDTVIVSQGSSLIFFFMKGANTCNYNVFLSMFPVVIPFLVSLILIGLCTYSV